MRLCLSHADRVPSDESTHQPAVDNTGRALVGGRHDQLVVSRRGIDHRAVGECVRIEWGEEDSIEVFAEDGAASGEAVGRGAHGRAHDQPVATVGGGELAIDVERDFDHRKWRAGEYRNLVDCEPTGMELTAPENLELKQQMIDKLKMASPDLIKGRPSLIWLVVGKKPEPTQIDAQHGDLLMPHP